MSTERSDQNISKYISYVLRHKPESIGLELDREGWCSIEDLIRKSSPKYTITPEILNRIVAEDEKGRYSVSEDKVKIRANQGHSAKTVKITLKKSIPPTVLYHGTPEINFEAISKNGLSKMGRHHVHLSADQDTALNVGNRRRKAVALLAIDSASLLADGHVFYLSENSVWLIDHVPAQYISRITPGTSA